MLPTLFFEPHSHPACRELKPYDLLVDVVRDADQAPVKQWLDLRPVVRQESMDLSRWREQPDARIPDLDLQAREIAFRVFDREAKYILVLAGVNGRIERGFGGPTHAK